MYGDSPPLPACRPIDKPLNQCRVLSLLSLQSHVRATLWGTPFPILKFASHTGGLES